MRSNKYIMCALAILMAVSSASCTDFPGNNEKPEEGDTRQKIEEYSKENNEKRNAPDSYKQAPVEDYENAGSLTDIAKEYATIINDDAGYEMISTAWGEWDEDFREYYIKTEGEDITDEKTVSFSISCNDDETVTKRLYFVCDDGILFPEGFATVKDDEVEFGYAREARNTVKDMLSITSPDVYDMDLEQRLYRAPLEGYIYYGTFIDIFEEWAENGAKNYSEHYGTNIEYEYYFLDGWKNEFTEFYAEIIDTKGSSAYQTIKDTEEYFSENDLYPVMLSMTLEDEDEDAPMASIDMFLLYDSERHVIIPEGYSDDSYYYLNDPKAQDETDELMQDIYDCSGMTVQE